MYGTNYDRTTSSTHGAHVHGGSSSTHKTMGAPEHGHAARRASAASGHSSSRLRAARRPDWLTPARRSVLFRLRKSRPLKITVLSRLHRYSQTTIRNYKTCLPASLSLSKTRLAVCSGSSLALPSPTARKCTRAPTRQSSPNSTVAWEQPRQSSNASSRAERTGRRSPRGLFPLMASWWPNRQRS